MNIYEASMTTDERKDLSDSEFGIPSKRKFPLNDKSHVLSAIRFFRFAENIDKPLLAKNIKKAIDRFDMDVNIGEDTLLYKYLNKKPISESFTSLSNYSKAEDDLINKYIEIYKSRQSVDNSLKDINEELNDIFNETIEYHKYENDNSCDSLFIAIYKDIIHCLYYIETWNRDVCNDITNIIRTILTSNMCGDKNYFIRNLFRACSSYMPVVITYEIIYILLNYKDFKSTDNIDVLDIIKTLSKYSDMPNTTRYLENNVKDFQIYIRNIADVDEYGYPVLDKPKLESIGDIDTDTLLNESFTIDEHGTIRISLRPRESYMDQYDNCHKILHENYKNKNYEGMKTNLAFMFYLISKIEKDKKYKSRDPQLVKARAFAMNDFKTYLAHLQKYEPSFNFVEYYKSSEMGNYIITISKETIIGIKTLFKTIIG